MASEAGPLASLPVVASTAGSAAVGAAAVGAGAAGTAAAVTVSEALAITVDPDSSCTVCEPTGVEDGTVALNDSAPPAPTVALPSTTGAECRTTE